MAGTCHIDCHWSTLNLGSFKKMQAELSEKDAELHRYKKRMEETHSGCGVWCVWCGDVFLSTAASAHVPSLPHSVSWIFTAACCSTRLCVPFVMWMTMRLWSRFTPQFRVQVRKRAQVCDDGIVREPDRSRALPWTEAQPGDTVHSSVVAECYFQLD